MSDIKTKNLEPVFQEENLAALDGCIGREIAVVYTCGKHALSCADSDLENPRKTTISKEFGRADCFQNHTLHTSRVDTSNEAED